MYPTAQLMKSPLFQHHTEGWALEDRIQIAYERAEAIGRAYAMSAADILKLSPKFWQFHTDPIWSVDGAACSIATIQWNLCGGTLAMHANQPDIGPLLQQVLSFEVSGMYCLTEVGHGLDAFNLETTATLLPDGSFDLHTPHPSAAKFMPPTKPAGRPCIGVVFARTLTEEGDCGVKPFVVSINDGATMCPGITCKLLPPRGGSRPMNHSITYFDHVRLPSTALLGSIKKPANLRDAFFYHISRVACGTLAIGSLGVPGLQVSSYIAARYSLRRKVTMGKTGVQPIIAFRTQQVPVLTALAQSFVMRALHEWAVQRFMDISVDARVRHAMASIVKVVMIQHAQSANLGLGDRCGAQGLFEVNQLTGMFADMRGTAIAEGDTLAISVRLASELLQGRFSVPLSTDSESILAKHETGVFSELRDMLSTIKDHRSETFNRFILPQSQHLLQAIGHRMAYDAAVTQGVEKYIIDLYIASCVTLDPAWYVENMRLSRWDQRRMESDAVDAVFPHLEELLERTQVAPYITAPIVSDETWATFVDSIPAITHVSPVSPSEKSPVSSTETSFSTSSTPSSLSSHSGSVTNSPLSSAWRNKVSFSWLWGGSNSLKAT
ncbi:acyl-CoA dehydrogenase NM domain-like protein [Fistulina hepatica ATCC 64428]|uniref:Acyl-CoA dehydrogenase NM domain-like protein n=1 Tax=Fistulina hepatica ATCC 64428 TaxID=1128425 RepID=A0A0D7AG82_9AGAR|nr:acyl-CoA dehydrogenase NM domain-like protein [Fistulina hepatica ATCC 64428]